MDLIHQAQLNWGAPRWAICSLIRSRALRLRGCCLIGTIYAVNGNQPEPHTFRRRHFQTGRRQSREISIHDSDRQLIRHGCSKWFNKTSSDFKPGYFVFNLRWWDPWLNETLCDTSNGNMRAYWTADMFLISCDGALSSFTFFFPGGLLRDHCLMVDAQVSAPCIHCAVAMREFY